MIHWKCKLWVAQAWLNEYGWRTYWYGVTLGRFGIGLLVRRKHEEKSDA